MPAFQQLHQPIQLAGSYDRRGDQYIVDALSPLVPPLHGEMLCKHQQPLRLSASAQSLHIDGSWREGVPAVRGGLSGADRLLCFARSLQIQNQGRRRQFAQTARLSYFLHLIIILQTQQKAARELPIRRRFIGKRARASRSCHNLTGRHFSHIELQHRPRPFRQVRGRRHLRKLT
jgi:hypothetical protein